jgi:hypothetical protein
MINMKNGFVSAMQSENNKTLTENGALALKSTNSDIVDLFGTIGALRSRKDEEVVRLFSKAYAEDKLLATKMSFYARNIRGGLGERRTARTIWKYMAETYTDVMRKNIEFIPMFGRWDDLYSLIDTPVEEDVWALIRGQFASDMEVAKAGKGGISIMSKWLKSTNSKNALYASWGKRTARALHMSDKEYRKARAFLNSYLDIVEVKMSKGDFTSIVYSGVTSRAMMKYRTTFHRRDQVGFEAYLESLKKGESKINSSTLYPYDILESYGLETSYGWRDSYLKCGKPFDTVLEEQWKALPNYVQGENNVLVMADTSGSMSGRPLATSVSLALYFAERNKGAFKDVFMTFSDDPKFVTVKGETLRDKVSSIEAIVANTDIEKAYRKILEVSVANNVSAEDMPKALVIISDMEFDRGTYGTHNTYYERIKQEYENVGYAVPTVIFWNVASRQDTFHVACDKKGVQLASGSSPSTFKSVLANLGRTPYEAVVETLNDEMYSMITV